jgi:Bacterial type II/III secretion system short domain
MNAILRCQWRSSVWLLVPVALLLNLACPTGVAPAQAPTGPAKKVDQPEQRNRLLVFELKWANAGAVARVITTLFTGKDTLSQVAITFDDLTNSVIVRGANQDQLHDIEALIDKLENQAQHKPGEDVFKMRVVQLPESQTNEKLLKAALEMTSSKNANCRTFYDSTNRKLLIYGDPKYQAEIEAVITVLDQTRETAPKAAAKAASFQVRILWFESGSTKEEASSLPPYMQQLVPALGKLGLVNPKLMANTLVFATENQNFMSRGFSRANVLATKGTLAMNGEQEVQLALTLSIDPMAKNAVAVGNTNLATIETVITAPLGQFVVLGMLPMDTATSAFVLQVTKAYSEKP